MSEVERDWDTLGGEVDATAAPVDQKTREQRDLIEEYELAAARKEAAQQIMKALAPQILESFEPHPDHTETKELGGKMVTVTWPSKWEWDKAKLEAILGESDEELPVFVEKKIGISRTKFNAQPPTVQRDYLPALTIGVGTPKILITNKGD